MFGVNRYNDYKKEALELKRIIGVNYLKMHRSL